jgi:hypothetical protein
VKCLAFGRCVIPPDAVRSALLHVFADIPPLLLDRVRVVEHSWFARAHGRVIATTRPRRIFLHGSAAAFFADPELVLHEYCHVLLQWEPRRLTTPRYLLEWLRRGYWDNAFEVEARGFALDNLARFRARLVQPSSASR